MKFKMFGVLSIIALAVCSPASAQDSLANMGGFVGGAGAAGQPPPQRGPGAKAAAAKAAAAKAAAAAAAAASAAYASAAASAAVAAVAADTNDFPVVKVNGQTLTNAYVGWFDSTYAYVWQRVGGGGGKFKLSDLPPDVQARCHYDAAALARQKADLKKQADAAAVAAAEAKHRADFRIVDSKEVPVSDLVHIQGTVLQVLHTENAVLLSRDEQLETTHYENGHATSVITESVTGKTVYIKLGNVNDIVDGDPLQVVALRAGAYLYKNTFNADTTVEKYIASRPIPPPSETPPK
jgi:hypothetical protein